MSSSSFPGGSQAEEAYKQRLIARARQPIERLRLAVAARIKFEALIKEFQIPLLDEQLKYAKLTIVHSLSSGHASGKITDKELLKALKEISQKLDDDTFLGEIVRAISERKGKQGRPGEVANLANYAREIAKIVGEARPELFPSTRPGPSRPAVAEAVFEILSGAGVPTCLMPKGSGTVFHWIKSVSF